MPTGGHDPYHTLGVSPDASDAELRGAYRRLVQLHHPDHNGGSPESARRFEDVQSAYARIRELRRAAPRSAQAPGGAAADPAVESRIAALERELRAAQAARDRARRAAEEAALPERGPGQTERPSDEELGYVRTKDSFASILADARSELGARLADELEGLATRLRDHPPR